MSADAIARLLARVQDEYLNNGHLALLIDDYNAIAKVGNYSAQQAVAAAASAAAAAAALTLMQALGASAYGIGVDPMNLVRRLSLGSAAFVDAPQLIARRVLTQNSTYNIKPHDFQGAMLLTTGGTVQYNLPAWSALPKLCPPLPGKNRSGNNLTFNPQATDSINGGSAGSAITIPTGSSWDCYVSPTTGAFEVRVYA